MRYVHQADLAAWSVPIANWGRIVPFLVAGRRFTDWKLQNAIEEFVTNPTTLDTVIERFCVHDGTAVETALYQLLADGRVESHDVAPLRRSVARPGFNAFEAPPW